MASAKKPTQQLLDRLPDGAGWDDIMYELYVKQKIECGRQAAADGKTVPHAQVRRRLLVMKLEWSAPVVEDLRSLHACISKDSVHCAALFVERLLDAAERLVDFPEGGRPVPEMPAENVREPIAQGQRIIYWVDAGSRATIPTVAHGRRKLTGRDITPRKTG